MPVSSFRVESRANAARRGAKAFFANVGPPRPGIQGSLATQKLTWVLGSLARYIPALAVLVPMSVKDLIRFFEGGTKRPLFPQAAARVTRKTEAVSPDEPSDAVEDAELPSVPGKCLDPEP
eukprot:s3255_g1.t1